MVTETEIEWHTRYLPPAPLTGSGRADLPEDACFYQHIKPINLLNDLPPQTSHTAFALVGFNCDEGVKRDHGRTGAAEGAKSIRQRLANLPIQKPAITCYDVGDITCSDHNLEQSQRALAEVINILQKLNIRPIVLGGGHELTWGHYQGLRQSGNRGRMGIINFDAHFDLNPNHSKGQGSATTSFHQIAEAHRAQKLIFDYNCIGIQHAGNIRHLFELAKKLKTKLILADELHQGLREKCFDFIDRIIDENEYLYVSLSMDVFSPAFAPGVGTIQPLGLYPWHIIPLIRQVAASGKVISYDIAEHVPRYDIDHRTAKLAATLIYEIIHHHNEHPRTW